MTDFRNPPRFLYQGQEGGELMARHLSRRQRLEKEKELKRSELINLTIAVVTLIDVLVELFQLFT